MSEQFKEYVTGTSFALRALVPFRVRTRVPARRFSVE